MHSVAIKPSGGRLNRTRGQDFQKSHPPVAGHYTHFAHAIVANNESVAGYSVELELQSEVLALRIGAFRYIRPEIKDTMTNPSRLMTLQVERLRSYSPVCARPSLKPDRLTCITRGSSLGSIR